VDFFSLRGVIASFYRGNRAAKRKAVVSLSRRWYQYALVNLKFVRRMCLVADLIIVLVFVVIGRATHDHGVYVLGVLSTAWPFGTGLTVGWLAMRATGQLGTSARDGGIICLITVAVGMMLRVVAGQGTAFAFVLVALGFLGASMIGWRVLVNTMRRRLARRWP
jgi:hypothetical protein